MRRFIGFAGLLALAMALTLATQPEFAVGQTSPVVKFAPVRGAPDDGGGGISPSTDPHAWPDFSQADSAKFVFAGIPPTLPRLYQVSGNLITCNDEYVVLDSPVTNGPIWVAEHLTSANMETAAKTMVHVYFHDPSNLPAGLSGRERDYKSGGYVYGQLAPQGDMTSNESQYQADSLANIVPMDNTLAYGLWPKLAGMMRSFAYKYGDEFVVTGPIFSGSFRRIGPDGVAVPNYLFKAFYLTATGGSGVYVVPNDNTGHLDILSLSEFTKRTGLNPFPLLPASYLRPFKLPDPRITSTKSQP